jgi:hypothetical protein
MTFIEFRDSTKNAEPPDGLAPALLALWHDARGDWETAHNTAQDIPDPTGAWIHAYLHRKEGDLSNAAYWYRRARQPEAQDSLDAEWERIATALVGGGSST